MFLAPTLCFPIFITPKNLDDYYFAPPNYSLVRNFDEDVYRSRIVRNEDNLTIFYPLDEKINFLLSKFNSIENKTEVYSFLLQNEYLLDLLSESLEELRKYFPDDIQIEVSVVDNTMDDEANQLVIFVNSGKKEFLFDELDNFDYGWWLSRIHKSKGLLIFQV